VEVKQDVRVLGSRPGRFFRQAEIQKNDFH
jgi:hypothetical protein